MRLETPAEAWRPPLAELLPPPVVRDGDGYRSLPPSLGYARPPAGESGIRQQPKRSQREDLAVIAEGIVPRGEAVEAGALTARPTGRTPDGSSGDDALRYAIPCPAQPLPPPRTSNPLIVTEADEPVMRSSAQYPLVDRQIVLWEPDDEVRRLQTLEIFCSGQWPRWRDIPLSRGMSDLTHFTIPPERHWHYAMFWALAGSTPMTMWVATRFSGRKGARPPWADSTRRLEMQRIATERRGFKPIGKYPLLDSMSVLFPFLRSKVRTDQPHGVV
eukprot:TRINITY_DN57326_c0_g1_i1.p1 TRINITY_DN57326_c0_g1~~TRINITY_DN57326_c0_g1_i1.p1  ORF type:complete len:273 (-),score=50.59 TRINITY_DN57326_c0_g1_i1:684-1502(-)